MKKGNKIQNFPAFKIQKIDEMCQWKMILGCPILPLSLYSYKLNKKAFRAIFKQSDIKMNVVFFAKCHFLACLSTAFVL